MAHHLVCLHYESRARAERQEKEKELEEKKKEMEKEKQELRNERTKNAKEFIKDILFPAWTLFLTILATLYTVCFFCCYHLLPTAHETHASRRASLRACKTSTARS